MHFEITTNQGAVFGLGQGQKWLFLAVSVVAIACTATQRIARTVGFGAIAVIAIAAATQWRMPPLPDLRYDRSVAAFKALPVGAQMRIPILPNWNMTLTRTADD